MPTSTTSVTPYCRMPVLPLPPDEDPKDVLDLPLKDILCRAARDAAVEEVQRLFRARYNDDPVAKMRDAAIREAMLAPPILDVAEFRVIVEKLEAAAKRDDTVLVTRRSAAMMRAALVRLEAQPDRDSPTGARAAFLAAKVDELRNQVDDLHHQIENHIRVERELGEQLNERDEKILALSRSRASGEIGRRAGLRIRSRKG